MLGMHSTTEHIPDLFFLIFPFKIYFIQKIQLVDDEVDFHMKP